MEWLPAASVDVDRVATPEELRAPVPMVVVPSAKVTVPVGVVVPEAGATVAVKVTLVPLRAVEAEADSEVVVATRTGAALTVTMTGVEVLPLKLASPV